MTGHPGDWSPTPGLVPPVVVVGDVMTDVVVRMGGPLAWGSDTPSTVDLIGGGSAANVAAWLAYLGAPVALAGRVGDDPTGRAAEADLAAAGVACWLAVDPAEPTGTCVVLVGADGERSMLPDAAASRRLTPRDVPRGLFRPGRHLHLSGYALLADGPREAGRHALALAREHRMTVSVDPSSAALLDAVGRDRFLDWTRGSSLVLANAEEARVLTGVGDPRAAAEQLAGHYAEAVVTLGAGGALWHGGFIAARVAADAVDVVDTTGAGDSFTAGFLASWLRHPEPETALVAGNRLAGQAVARVGARPPAR